MAWRWPKFGRLEAAVLGIGLGFALGFATCALLLLWLTSAYSPPF